MQRKIITTKDNSKTLLIPDMNETYHSTHGALTEALHIFINSGIKQFLLQKDTINIFEMGFGTGLNAILTFQYAQNNYKSINYTTIEKYPIKDDEISALNYKSLLKLTPTESKVYFKMHRADSNDYINLGRNFLFKLISDDINKIEFKKNEFDIIYFDAFAPQHQPQLWEVSLLTKMYDYLKPNGFLITYCAQGKFKRTLKEIGFKVEALEGPPGKREITKAIKQ